MLPLEATRTWHSPLAMHALGLYSVAHRLRARRLPVRRTPRSHAPRHLAVARPTLVYSHRRTRLSEASREQGLARGRLLAKVIRESAAPSAAPSAAALK